MNRLIYYLQFIIVCLVLFSCDEGKKSENVSSENSINQNIFNIKYAKGFEIEEKLDFKVITLNDAWKNENTAHQYVLYKNQPPKGYEDALLIKVPIQKIACMSVTHVALINQLNQLNSIVAMTGRNSSSNKLVQDRVKNNQIKEMGGYQQMNYELLLDLSPDVVMAFGIDQSSSSHVNKLKALGLNVVLNAEYMELHPLGKLEWIKFMAAFYDMDEEANQIFDKIEKEYIELTNLTKKIKTKPTVFVGMPWNGVWYVPGGSSFVAQYFKDAGASYLWEDNVEQGSYAKSKEIIIDEAFEADYWLNLNSYSSMSEVIAYDERFNNFSAYKRSNLFNNNKRLNIEGGNDYWESGVVNPQIVLKDLIEIFHPEILEHELYYYHHLD